MPKKNTLIEATITAEFTIGALGGMTKASAKRWCKELLLKQLDSHGIASTGWGKMFNIRIVKSRAVKAKG